MHYTVTNLTYPSLIAVGLYTQNLPKCPTLLYVHYERSTVSLRGWSWEASSQKLNDTLYEKPCI